MTTPTLLARLRRPAPADVVAVSFTGTPAAVTAIARTLASVTTVTGMSHHVGDTDTTIRLDAVCVAPRAGGRRG